MVTKSYYCVCRCTPTKGIVNIDTKLLLEMLARDLHAMRCTSNRRLKARKALHLGDLCANSGYPRMALRIYEEAISTCLQSDIDNLDISCSGQWWHQSLMKDEALLLSSHKDALWQRLFPNEQHRSSLPEVRRFYKALWLEKFEL